MWWEFYDIARCTPVTMQTIPKKGPLHFEYQWSIPDLSQVLFAFQKNIYETLSE